MRACRGVKFLQHSRRGSFPRASKRRSSVPVHARCIAGTARAYRFPSFRRNKRSDSYAGIPDLALFAKSSHERGNQNFGNSRASIGYSIRGGEVDQVAEVVNAEVIPPMLMFSLSPSFPFFPRYFISRYLSASRTSLSAPSISAFRRVGDR